MGASLDRDPRLGHLRAARELITSQRYLALAVGLIGTLLVHFGTMTFQVKVGSTAGSALYLIPMTLVCPVLLRSRFERR